jgi:hypothetical protein
MKPNLPTCAWAGLLLGARSFRLLENETIRMKSKNSNYAVITAGLLCATGIMTANASSTFITFSVDESSNLVNGTFNPPAPANVGGTLYGGTGANQVYARGTFNGWGAYLTLVQSGTGPVYTNTIEDTVDANGGNLSYIYHDDVNGDEGPADWANRAAYLPTNSGASLVLPTPYFTDIGPATTANVKFQVDMSEQILLGNFKPTSGDTVIIAGSFNGWTTTPGVQFTLTNDPSIKITNNNFTPPLVLSSVYTVTAPITLNARYSGMATPGCAEDFKYVIMPEVNWDAPSYPNADSGNNRFFTEGDQTLPLVSFNDQPYSIAHVTFNLDMSGVATYDTNFVPGSVTAWGTFNSWAGGVQLSNNPAAPNPNLYSATIAAGEGAPYTVQFRYTNSYTGAWVYDYAQDGGPNWVNNNNYRHTFNFPITGTPLVTNLNYYFNDLAPDDYLPQDTAVQFSVDMNGAVGTDGHAFVPGSDSVYINGMFAGAAPSQPSAQFGTAQFWYGWSSGINPQAAPPGYQMMQVGSSTVYTNTIIMPKGTPVGLSYQYGMDYVGAGGPVENEAAAQSVHYRGLRSTQFNPYVMPTDTFSTNPYVEPFFSTGNIGANGSLGGGNLIVGAPVAGRIPVSWLGRPGANLQSAGSLNGPWQNIPATDGTTWTAGASSTNGFVSVTNWPVIGTTFFRLAKP